MTIEDILSELGVEFHHAGEHHHCRPGWIQLDCPFCGPNSQSYHLGFNLESRYFNCWKCGGLPAVKVLKALGMRGPAAWEFIKDPEREASRIEEKERLGLVEPHGRGPLLPAHRRYLRDRGFNPEEIVRLWEIEGIGLSARLAWRIYIPIQRRGVRVSWTTRAIGTQVPQRYLSASAGEEARNHREVIYGLDYCRHSVVIVEGPLDAWAIGPGAGALFGIDFSLAQVRELIEIPYRYICFDSAPDAQRRAEDLGNQLSCFPGVTENLVLDAKDPGEASPKELRLIRRAAKLDPR